MSTQRTLLFLFTSILLLSTIFCFTPISHFSSLTFAKALSFFEVHVFNDHEPSSRPHLKLQRMQPLKLTERTWPEKPVFDEKDVVVLTGKNFSDFIAKHQYVMLDFYASWCYWSQRLAPEYAAAATILKGDDVVFAKVDASEEKELGKKLNIQGYPTLYLLVGGVEKIRYTYYGERTRDAIATWVRHKMGLVQTVTTTDEAQRILTATSVMVMGFLDTLGGPDGAELAAASKLNNDVNFYQTFNADVARLFHIDLQIKRPALGMLKRDTAITNHSYFGYDGQFTRSAISDFVLMYKPPSEVNIFNYHEETLQPVVRTMPDESPFNIFNNHERSSRPDKPVISVSNDLVESWLPDMPIVNVDNDNDESSWPHASVVNFFNDHEESLWPDKPIVNILNGHEQSLWPEKPVVDEKDVVVLTMKNFSDFIASNQYVMLNFYVSWCPWSTKLAPEYAAVATMLKGEVVLAKIDCTKETELAREYKIQGYPTMYLLVGGVQKVLYDPSDERTRDAMATWARQKISLAARNITTKEEAERILTDRSVMVLGFFDTLEGLDSEELAAASKQHIDVNFYQTANVDVAKLFHIDPQIKRPALVMLKRDNANHSHFDYDGQFTRSAIAEFVSIYKLPSVVTFTEADAPRIFDNPIMKQLWLFAPEYSWKVISAFEDAAKAFKGKLLFVHVETGYKSVGKQLSYEFGVTEGVPSVVAYMANRDSKHIYHGELNSCGIKSFAEEFLEGKLSRQSAPISKTFVRLP